MEGIEIVRYNPILQEAFAHIVRNNTSNHLPYHNLNHLLTVLKFSDYIVREEGVYYDKRLPLHLAALFHDVNHSGGELPDSENIKEEFIPKQRNFLESIKFFTPSANKFKESHWRQVMDEFRILEVCMNVNK